MDLILSMWCTLAVQENPRPPRQHYESAYVSTIYTLAPQSVHKHEINIVHDWRLNVENYYKKTIKKHMFISQKIRTVCVRVVIYFQHFVQLHITPM
jgi:hypothetical protein